MLKPKSILKLRSVKALGVLILLKIMLLTSACGKKEASTEKATIAPHPPEIEMVNGCHYRLDASPALGLNPDGEMDKYFAYLCGSSLLAGPYIYCSISDGYCFDSTDRYFDVSL